MIFTFTEDQVKAILEQPDQSTFTGFRDYTMMLILLETGIRVMELTNMKISDIDFQNQTIRIPMGKGRKPRVVPIQITCIKALMKYIQERGARPFYDVWITIINKPLRKAAIEIIIRTHCKKDHSPRSTGIVPYIPPLCRPFIYGERKKRTAV